MEDQSPGVTQEGAPEPQEAQATSPPALTITFQTWATPLVGLVMLALGLLGGYFGRPLLDTARPPSPQSAASAPATPNPALGGTGDQEAQQQALMEALIQQTVHFKGNPDAPVTLIEFSDFQ